MSLKKTLTGAVLAVALVLTASPAWAHEEISPQTVQVGKPAFLTLTAANEASSPLNKITLTAPAGGPFGEATRTPSGWTASKTDTAITWSGGSVAPETFETFGFEIEGPDQPGTLSYKVTSGFANGSTDTHTVTVTVVAAGTTPTTISSGGGATTTVAEATTTTIERTGEVAAKAKGKGDTYTRRANVALGLGAAALVLAIVALVRTRRRGDATAPPKEGRDW